MKTAYIYSEKNLGVSKKCLVQSTEKLTWIKQIFLLFQLNIVEIVYRLLKNRDSLVL